MLAWLVGTGIYTFNWVRAILRQPGLASYERSAGFQLVGFAFTGFPLLLIGLLVVIFVELVLGELILGERRFNDE